MSDSMNQLRAILAEVSDLNRAAQVLGWDQETYMPPGGVTARSEQLSTLSRLAHVRFTSEEVGRLLSDLEEETAGLPFDSLEKSLVRVTRRDYDQDRKLPAELIAEIVRAGSAAQPVWQKARRDADFKLFAPALEKNVELNRRMADALGYKDRPYDALLDRYEPGMTTDDLETIFAELKKAIVPLVADIARNADAVDDRVLYRGFDPSVQVKYALDVVTNADARTSRPIRSRPTSDLATPGSPRGCRATSSTNASSAPSTSPGTRCTARATAKSSTERACGAARRLACTNRSRGCGRTWSAAAGASGSTFSRVFATRFLIHSTTSMTKRSSERSTSRIRH
jgi:carboxypeptidase Taq